MAAELAKRLFLAEITEALRADKSFMAYCKRDDAFVNNNSVELPHAGTDPTIVINRSSFPGTVAQRTDSATQYLLEELSTNPSHIQWSEDLVVAYDKRASINMQHSEALIQKMGDRTAYKWGALVTGARLLSTTGTTPRPTDAPGATTSVKPLTKTDVLAGKVILDRDNAPQQGRYMLITASMYADLLALDEFSRADAYGTSNIPSGWVGRIYGFDVIVRSQVNRYATAGTIKDTEAANVATDTAGLLMYQRDMVRAALGGIKIFLSMDDPSYYGTVLSAAVRFGALNARADVKGIAAIKEVVST